MDNKVLEEFKQIISSVLGEQRFVGVIYGSYPNGTANEKSDIDAFICLPAINDNIFQNIKSAVVEFHKTYDLGLDNEVPYENKLLYTFDEIISALNFEGFEMLNGHLFIPEVEKTTEFLSSHKIKLRLAFNALTVPHTILGSERKFIEHILSSSSVALTLLAIDLVSVEQFSIDELIHSLLFSTNGLEGEMFLGYKDLPSVRQKLHDLLNEGLEYLSLKNYVVKISTNAFKIRESFSLEKFKIANYE